MMDGEKSTKGVDAPKAGCTSPPNPKRESPEAMVTGLGHKSVHEPHRTETCERFDTLVQETPPAPSRSRLPRNRRFGRFRLKTLISADLIKRMRLMWDNQELKNASTWPTSGDIRRENAQLLGEYKRANAIGDAMGAGSTSAPGLGLARDDKGRAYPSQGNAARCVKHLRSAGWSDDQIADIAAMTAIEFRAWVMQLPADSDVGSENTLPQPA